MCAKIGLASDLKTPDFYGQDQHSMGVFPPLSYLLCMQIHAEDTLAVSSEPHVRHTQSSPAGLEFLLTQNQMTFNKLTT